MSILQGPESQHTEFRNCKIHYLIAQNKLLSLQSTTISKMIKLYKQIIDIASKTIPDTDNFEEAGNQISTEENNKQLIQYQISQKLKAVQILVDQCLNECKRISESQELFPEEDEPFVTPQFFMKVVLSYERSISELKEQIHHRQVTLQELQNDKNHRLRRKFDPMQSTAAIKAIESYDIYPKISDCCRKQIVKLKMKKRQLQSKCAESFYGINTIRKQDNSSQDTEKTVKKIGNLPKTVQSNESQMSTFQKMILVYKKKKLFNQILERKVIDLKKKIKQKQVCNQLLRKKLEDEEWENFNRMDPPKNRNFQEQSIAYLSMLNESMRANNMDFSVDISRILPENILGDLKQDQKQNRPPMKNHNSHANVKKILAEQM